MTAPTKSGENSRPGRAGSHTGRVRQLRQVLRSWPRTRVTAAGLAAVFILAANGMMAGAGTGGTGYALVGAGSVLAGVLAGSYVNAPIGGGHAVRSALGLNRSPDADVCTDCRPLFRAKTRPRD